MSDLEEVNEFFKLDRDKRDREINRIRALRVEPDSGGASINIH
jgi:hypothetical protein